MKQSCKQSCFWNDRKLLRRIISPGRFVFMVGWVCYVANVHAQALQVAATNRSPQIEPLAKKHDANGNGKIDVQEHRDYARELATKKRAELKELARNRPMLNRQERLFYRLPDITPDRLNLYDTNRNGRIDVSEQGAIFQDAAGRAREEFRRHDRNGDGKLDTDELKSVDSVWLKRKPRESMRTGMGFPGKSQIVDVSTK